MRGGGGGCGGVIAKGSPWLHNMSVLKIIIVKKLVIERKRTDFAMIFFHSIHPIVESVLLLYPFS